MYKYLYNLSTKASLSKDLFEKLVKQVKQFPPMYEKVYIYRNYGEFLLEENPKNFMGNSKKILTNRIHRRSK